MRMRFACALIAGGAFALLTGGEAGASSHREAPFISKMPKVDNTDLYAFQSYEGGRTGFTTLIANFQPLQDSYGGPNYFTMDPEALYEIHIDNDGDAKEDLTFQFRFSNTLGGTGGAGIAIPVGGKNVNIPFIVANVDPGGSGVVAPFSTTTPRHVNETYSVKLIRGNRRTGTAANVTHAAGDPGADVNTFIKPIDNIGQKVFGGNTAVYEAYATAYKYSNVVLPGCAATGAKVFVGQRQEMFAVNLGPIFDLVNAPLDNTALLEPNGGANSLGAVGTKNVTSIAIEVPTSCLTAATVKPLGIWSTTSIRQARVINPGATYAKPSREGGAWVQVSRLGAPLVNEVVIGLKDKDHFNSSEPKDDAQFADYVTNPTLPTLIQLIFGTANAPAPNLYPRADLVQAFLTGVTGVNANGSTAEMLRLNTALPATAAAAQFTAGGRGLGAAGCFVADTDTTKPRKLDASAGNANCDPAGFPNGRRPGDDVVDIALRVAMGYLLQSGTGTVAPAGLAPLGDGLQQRPDQFTPGFPYLQPPHPGD